MKTILSRFAISITSCFVLSAMSVGGATISEDFESTSGSTLPTGWSLVTVGSGSYTTTTGHNGTGGGTGNGGLFNSTGASGVSGTPGLYTVSSGISPFDARQSISGTFDVKITASGNYDSGAFMLGDIADGLSGDAGEFLWTTFNRSNFSNDDPEIKDGAGTTYTPGQNQQKFTSDVWYEADFAWTPTIAGIATGNFTITIRQASNDSLNYSITTDSEYSFDNAAVYFGFGDIDAAGATFDNISITGTNYVVPEPGSFCLLVLGGMMMSFRRRR